MLYKNKYIILEGHHALGKQVKIEGRAITLVPLTVQNCWACHDLGLPLYDPMLTYDYSIAPIVPYEHQRQTASFLALNPRAFCWNEAGTGKTASCLWAIDYLFAQKEIASALIICPLSTTRAVWFKECMRLVPKLYAEVLIGAAAKRRKLLAQNFPIYITNHDGVKTLKEDFLGQQPDLVIVDESTAFKTVRTNRWKALNAITKNAKYVWLLSGTPAPQAPTDLYAQGRIVCPELTGKSFIRFRDQVMYPVNQFKWAPKHDFEERIKDLIQPVIRFTRRECLDLPAIVYQTIDVRLSTKQQHAFDNLRKLAIVEIQSKQITAVNEGVMRNKLLQCCGGNLYGTDETTTRFSLSLEPTERIAAVLDLIEECARGVLIFVPYLNSIDAVHAQVVKHGVVAKTITGETSLKTRTQYFQQFQEGTIKVLIAHPRTMGHGVTLTYADTVIWYIVSSDNELYEQANSRIQRIGQENKMRVIHLVSTTLESKVLQRLQDKKTIQGVLLEALGE